MSKPPAASARAASSANQNGGGGGGSGRSSPQGDTVPMTPEKELYPRRLPRIGIQFQTRIPKSTAPSDRPAPFLMSVDFPYLSRDDVQKEQLQIKSTLSTPPVIKKRPEESQTEEGSSTTTTNGRWPSKQKQSSEFPQAIFSVPGDRQTSRGGTLLHRPIQNMDEYTSFCQPLISSLPPDAMQVTLADQAAWKQHMIQLHQSEQAAALAAGVANVVKRGRSARGGTKRKREATATIAATAGSGDDAPSSENDNSSSNYNTNNDDEGDQMVWRLEEMLENQRDDNNFYKKRRPHGRSNSDHLEACSRDVIISGEDEATVMEHLHATAGGDVDVGKFNVLVQFTAGQGVKMRKTRERRWAKNKPRSVVLHYTTDTWRELYQKMQFPSLLGQLKDDTEVRFMVNSQSLPSHSTNLDEWDEKVDDFGAYETEDDLKDTWRSILTCAKSVERQLTGNGHSERKPYLSTVLTFISNAYNLPPPEECFGTNHVMIEELATSFVTILNEAEKAQEAAAKVRDKIHSSSVEGIESGALLKLLDAEFGPMPFRLREVDRLRSYQSVVVEWEARVASMLDHDDDEVFNPDSGNTLEAAEKLKEEAKSHGYISQALVQLDARIRKAYDLRRRILDWNQTCQGGSLGSTKALNALIREAHRVKLIFQEVSEIVETHSRIEGWIDRANVALRSRIALTEVKELLSRAKDLSVDLSEYEEKLLSRASSADEWFSSLKDAIEVPTDVNGEVDMLELLKNFEQMLGNGGHGQLHDLALEGSRIPVDVDAVRLLQVAMDAKIWTTKAEKWIPTCEDSRKGKLADVREHAAKALELRERLPLSHDQKEGWIIRGEKELDDVVESADAWYEKYAQYLEGDKRRAGGRECISISTLRTIVDEGDAVFANLGNSTLKMSRILAQAESWYNEHLSTLRICKIGPYDDDKAAPADKITSPEDISKAVDAAKAEVSLELEEAVNLRVMIDKIEHWREQVSLIAPKRIKRNGKATRPKLTFDDLIRLIEAASTLPIDTADDVQRLQMQLSNIQVWRSRATAELEKIVSGFSQLESHVNTIYGEPHEFSLEQVTGKSNGTTADLEEDDKSKSSGNESTEQSGADTQSMREMPMDIDNSGSSVGESDVGDSMLADYSYGDVNIFRLIRELQDSAKDNGVTTPEGDLVDLLQSVAQWCLRSFKYLNTPRDIFDKRFFGAFDRFLKDGEDLLKDSEEFRAQSSDLAVSVCDSWKQLVSDQLRRLDILKEERETFVRWCQNATQLLADDKKLTKEKLDDLAKSSRLFPAGSDVVSKVRSLSTKVSKWVRNVQEHLQSGNKLDMQDVKTLIDSGEKLKCSTNELRTLKAELRAAKAWSNLVEKCNIGQGSVHAEDIEHLIKEYDSLLIEMPDEFEELKQATVGYCVCRRPYEGFMIGCDHCDEWYHGPCIGITESRAERFEKFSCIRCSAKKCFEMSASAAAGLVRKWTCKKDLKKARQVENQKIQRKYRKEKKDIEKYEQVITEAESALLAIDKQNNTNAMAAAPNSSVSPVSQDKDCTKFEPKSGVPIGETAVSVANDGAVVGAIETRGIAPPSQPVADTTGDSRKEMEKVEEGLVSSDIPSYAATSSSANTCLSMTSENPSDDKKLQDIDIYGDPPRQNNKYTVLAQLEKTRNDLDAAKARLDGINQTMRERKLADKKEDEKAAVFRRFFLLVRSHVLVPSQALTAETARPLFGIKLSSPMVALWNDARDLGIDDFPDVQAIFNSFRCMTWSLSVMAILQRKPSMAEVTFLLNASDSLKLPDEKVLRTMKYMESRIAQFQAKVKKALGSAESGDEAKTIKTQQLEELHVEKSELPLEIADILAQNPTHEDQFSSDFSPYDSYLSIKKMIALAPDPKSCWPPFGLLSSQTAIDTLGLDCANIPDPSVDQGANTTAKEQTAIKEMDNANPSTSLSTISSGSEVLKNETDATLQAHSTSPSVLSSSTLDHPVQVSSTVAAVAIDRTVSDKDITDCTHGNSEAVQLARAVIETKLDQTSNSLIDDPNAYTTKATEIEQKLPTDCVLVNRGLNVDSTAEENNLKQNGVSPMVDDANKRAVEHKTDATTTGEVVTARQPAKQVVYQPTVLPATEESQVADKTTATLDIVDAHTKPLANSSIGTERVSDPDSCIPPKNDADVSCASKTVSQNGSPEQQKAARTSEFMVHDSTSTLCNGGGAIDQLTVPQFAGGITVMKDANA